MSGITTDASFFILLDKLLGISHPTSQQFYQIVFLDKKKMRKAL